jgi:hypothetical protein
MEDNKEILEEWVVNQEASKEKVMKRKRKRSIKLDSNEKEINNKDNEIIINDAFDLTEEEKRKCIFLYNYSISVFSI